VVGANAVVDWDLVEGARVGTHICNSAFFIPADSGKPVTRYDKVCLVPFSERVPFADGPMWLRRMALSIAADRATQPLHPGAASQAAVISLQAPPGIDSSNGRTSAVRLLTPICLENIDPAFVASMMRDRGHNGKRADVIVNLSNDGWFAEQERHQHLQSMALRCIENRVPMIRSSNTGISGFFDSRGRLLESIAASTAGFATVEVPLDDRTTVYTRFGDVFAYVCGGLLVIAGAARIARFRKVI
jgi:apolipoprotein N-acyltransferase